ncbi:Splicing factor PWI [Penicillium mononematosum]|uniref:Splicing factor PWI n=1 Tax=Penicillium mononematosum TaxID=268346 RepID=UPI002548FC42|nr:Splicing factor PWI [Penicillium mononematosum]KAJ6178539.1 Splicing factor PWI [Penicillium mononematosum]
MASSVDAKLIRRTKFPPEFNKKVDMTKVNVEVMKKWIASQISKILGNEDDVVIELCFAHLEGSRFPDIKLLQIQLTGFLDKDTPKFCQELWSLCLSGQENPQGVPKELLEAKKLELIQEKVILEAEKASEALRRQREQDQTRERELDDVRRRERSDRGRGEEAVTAVAVEVGDETSTEDLRPPETETAAETASANLHLDVTLTLTCQLAIVAAAVHPDLHTAPVLHPDPQSHRHHLAETAMNHATDDANVAPVPQATQYLPSDATAEEREGEAVRITVIVGYRRRQSSVSRSSVSRSRSRRSSARYARRDSRRLSRSRSRSPDRTGTRDRGENRRRRSPSGGRSRSRSRSVKKDTDGKRRRSIERYNPDEKRRKMADENEDSTRTPSKSDEPSKTDDNETKVAEQTKKPLSAWVNSTGFREKLLRERCIAMRRRSGEKPSSASPPKQD